MTREEAIKIVQGARQYLMAGNPIWDVKKIDEAMSMAIEALTQDSRKVTQESDLISRQDAIDALGEEPDIWRDTEEEWAYRNAWVEHISAIKSLPSAEATGALDDAIAKYVADGYMLPPSAEAVPIHEDGTLEVKVPNAQKVGRVLVMDTDSHIGGGLFYPESADAVKGEECDHCVYKWGMKGGDDE